MQVRTVPVHGGEFTTEVLEAGSGEPLLFLHGLPGIEVSELLLNRLAERYRVIAPRHPGFGNSTGTEHLLDLHDLIFYYLDFLDAEGLRGVPIIGHSLGGMFAAELAAVQPDRFSNVVLMAPFGLWNPGYPVADFFSMTPKELAAATYHDAASSVAVAAAQAPEDNEAYIHFMVERAKSLATAAKYLWPIPNRGLNKRLHRISAPTLLVWGESDRIVPTRYADDFMAKLPAARLEMIPRAGHLPQLEQLDILAEVIESFLSAR